MPDVRERAAHRVEEHEIARLQFAHADLLADAAHFLGAARQRHAERVLEDVAHEAAAIEAGVRRVAASSGNGTPIMFSALTTTSPALLAMPERKDLVLPLALLPERSASG